MRQKADKICQNESIGSEIRELKALLDRKNMTVEEIKKLIKQSFSKIQRAPILNLLQS